MSTRLLGASLTGFVVALVSIGYSPAHEIVGNRWGRTFRAGDRVNVILDRILAQERRLQFSIVEEGIPLTGKKPARVASKPKKARHLNASTSKKNRKMKSGKRGKRR